jgi:DNA-binding NtrC family response regulator
LLDDLHAIDEEGSRSLHDFLESGRYAPLMGEPNPLHSDAAIVCTVETPVWNKIKTEGLLPKAFTDRVERRKLIIPPFSERLDDLACLVDHYCAKHAEQTGKHVGLTNAAVEWLLDFRSLVSGARDLQNVLHDLLGDNPGMFELDVADVKAYALRNNLLPAPSPVNVRVDRPRPPRTPDPLWADVPSLAVAALEQELKLSTEQAERLREQLFEGPYPEIWESFLKLKASHKDFDLRLFTELLRYYAIIDNGNVVEAAAPLGVTRQALGEFVNQARRTRKRPKA